MQQQPGILGTFGALLPLLVIFVIFYLLLILPMKRRQKKHQQMLTQLTKGDRVVTSGGIFGTVVSVEGDVVNLRVAENVKLQVARSAVAGQAKDAGTADLNPTEPK
ncbi:MAG: preprotein translocase subunit YajC [Acidobacteriota bacterium]